MAFFASRRLFYFKNYPDRHVMNPLRRHLYVKLAGYCAAGLVLSFPALYSLAAWKLRTHDTYFASETTLTFLDALPLNILSRAWGHIADSQRISLLLHRMLILMYAHSCGVKEEELNKPLSAYRTLQEFFCRSLKDGSRPADKSAWLVAPCDGTVLSCGTLDEVGCIVQAKGCKYHASSLFGGPPVTAVPSGHQRCFVVFHLKPSDYHHFHAPANMKILSSVQIPGRLLPVTDIARRYIPQLYITNERAGLTGRSGSRFVGMMCVGATCVGNIHFRIDERVVTNSAAPPTFSVHRNYWEKGPDVHKGEELGFFSFGSSIVLVADVPKTESMCVKAGDKVRAGQRLIA